MRDSFDQTIIDERTAEIERLREALQEITEGKGAFSTDRYQHAFNTIEGMKQIARDALGDVGEVPK